MMQGREQRLIDRLERALAVRGTQAVSDVLQAARDGRAQVWEGDQLLLVTEIKDYPLYRSLHYATVAGDMNDADLIGLQATADAWGREQGCTRAETIGRRGWERSPQWTAGWKHIGGYWMKDFRS
jgi:hypothetical protein